MTSFKIYTQNHIGKKKKRRIDTADADLIKDLSKKHEYVFKVSEATVLHFDEGFVQFQLSVDTTSSVTVISFGEWRTTLSEKRTPSSAITVTTRIMEGIRKRTTSPVTDDEIRDFCTLSTSFAEGILQALLERRLSICHCPDCDRGQVYAYEREDKYMLMCDTCDTPYNKLEQGQEWLRKLVNALMYKHAVDNVVYASYSGAHSTMVFDEIHFTDSIDPDSKLITGTVFVRQPLASKIKLTVSL